MAFTWAIARTSSLGAASVTARPRKMLTTGSLAVVREEVEELQRDGKHLPAAATRPMRDAVLA